MSWDQILIIIFGVSAVFMSQVRGMQRYACIAGLLGQPAWFYAAAVAAQPGVFIVCILYTIAWLQGVWTYWIAPRRRRGTVNLPAGTIVKLHGVPCELVQDAEVHSTTIALNGGLENFERAFGVCAHVTADSGQLIDSVTPAGAQARPKVTAIKQATKPTTKGMGRLL